MEDLITYQYSFRDIVLLKILANNRLVVWKMVKSWMVLLCLKVKICLYKKLLPTDYLHSNVEFLGGFSFGLILINAMFLILMLSRPMLQPISALLLSHDHLLVTFLISCDWQLTTTLTFQFGMWAFSFSRNVSVKIEKCKDKKTMMEKWEDYKKGEKKIENRKGIDKFLFLFNKTKKK